MTKKDIIERINAIANLANSYDNGYHYEVKVNEWVKYGKNRTYFSIVETRDNSKHYVKKDYGYYDNNADEFVAGKASIEYTFSGEKFEEPVEVEEEIIETETTETAETTEFCVEVAFIENGTTEEWDADVVQENVEAVSAEEAMSIARDYVHNCIVENGENPDAHDFVLRAAEFRDGAHGGWIYEN